MSLLDELYLLSRQYLEINNRVYRRQHLIDSLFGSRLSIIIGQRGVGKTTLIIQKLLEFAGQNLLSQKILYVPSDHFLLGTRSLYEIAENFQQLGGELIAFDEIHKYKNWSQELKSIYESFPNLKIIASGSSALEIHKESHDLSRRAIVYQIQGFSFREYLELHLGLVLPRYTLEDILQNHEKITPLILKKIQGENKKILLEFKQYLKVGYYPYFLDIKDEKLFFVTLEQNFHTTIEGDLASIHPDLTGNSIRKIKQLLIFIASAVPFVPNFAKLKTLIEVGDERTLKTYLKYLEDAGLIAQVPRTSTKLHKIEAIEKIYLQNTNQIFALALGQQNTGTVRELFFLTTLAHTHAVSIPKSGDFAVDNKLFFEIGGKNKTFGQIQEGKDTYLALDEIEIGMRHKIPLWLFGFIY